MLAVSDDPEIRGYAKRKAALRRQVAAAGEEAMTLFAADKISKLRELRRETLTGSESGDGRPRSVRARRIRHYRACLRLLARRIPDSPLLPELREEFGRQLRDRAIRESLMAAAS